MVRFQHFPLQSKIGLLKDRFTAGHPRRFAQLMGASFCAAAMILRYSLSNVVVIQRLDDDEAFSLLRCVVGELLRVGRRLGGNRCPCNHECALHSFPSFSCLPCELTH